MRKLTVKNFSVIKDAELEFGKITVLIGPQASGKSILCKLALFLGREVFSLAIARVVQRPEFGYSDYVSTIQREFVKWFPRGGWGSESWSIAFKSMDFEVSIESPSPGKQDEEISVLFSDNFKNAYEARMNATLEMRNRREIIIAQALESLAASEFLELAGRAVWDSSTYIPTERSYFLDTATGYKMLGTENDPVLTYFAGIFALSLNPALANSRISKYLDGNIVSWQDGWMMAFSDDRFLPLSQLSSGSKATLPILSILDYYESQRKPSGNLPSQELYGKKLYIYDDFTIEEPESSVFPDTQYELVKEVASLSNEINFRPQFTITTHSPYILAAFNNLLEAWNVVETKPELKAEVEKIIPSKYWIKKDDFKAYSIHEGKLASILAEETGLVSSNYLDQVSETIGFQFDELLRLGYVEA